MKNQYFGDTRDLFKFDLVQVLVEGIPLRHFRFLPMLTRDDGRGGRRRELAGARAGTLNRDLTGFLGNCARTEDRDVSRICSYFMGRGMNTSLVPDPFTHAGRRDYFARALAGLPPSSLVLLDPDNGLEVGYPGGKHLLFSDLSDVLRAVDDSSLVMIFQYYPRVDREEYRERRVREIHRETGMRPLWITDNQIIFFLVGSAKPVLARAAPLLAGYALRYPALRAGV